MDFVLERTELRAEPRSWAEPRQRVAHPVPLVLPKRPRAMPESAMIEPTTPPDTARRRLLPYATLWASGFIVLALTLGTLFR